MTGKNGSGKTSVLESIRDFLKAVENGNFNAIENWEMSITHNDLSIKSHQGELSRLNLLLLKRL